MDTNYKGRRAPIAAASYEKQRAQMKRKKKATR
jgi:hypothetical protein